MLDFFDEPARSARNLSVVWENMPPPPPPAPPRIADPIWPKRVRQRRSKPPRLIESVLSILAKCVWTMQQFESEWSTLRLGVLKGRPADGRIFSRQQMPPEREEKKERKGHERKREMDSGGRAGVN